MTYREAAIELLRSAPEPLHYKELTDLAIERRLIEPQGQTPAMTMGSQLYVLARRAAEGADVPPIQSVGGGRFRLGPQLRTTRLDEEIAENNAEVKENLLAYLREIEPRQLEHLVGQLLTELGYEDVEVTQYVGDEGIDVVANLTAGGVANVRTAVQVKRQAANVQRPIVQQLRGSLAADQRGLIITTGGFSPGAITEATTAARLPIALVDGDQLVSLLVEHGIGITRRSAAVLELDLDSLATPVDETDGNRSATLWPLPGGQDHFFESLLKFLDRIGDQGVELSALTQWVIDEFEQVTKETVVSSYLRSVLASMRLVSYEGELVMLSDAGQQLRASREVSELLEVLRREILGIDELIELLTDGPRSLEALNEDLIGQINRTWETPTQTRYRLQWLANAGVVERDGGEWRLRPEFSTSVDGSSVKQEPSELS